MRKKQTKLEFAICVADEGFDDLEIWKVYRILSDPKASAVDCLRVIDDSGEDYLYPKKRFIVLELQKSKRDQLLAAVGA